MLLTPSVLLTRSAALAATSLRAWAQVSQQRARRNAMVAATAAAQRRAQREEVEDYLARRAGRTTTYDAVGPPGTLTGERSADLPGDLTGEA